MTIDAACNVEYGTRVVQKRDGGNLFPVYGGGGATFFMDTSNRTNRVVVSRFGMSALCTRYVDGEFFLNDSGLTLSPRSSSVLLPEFLDRVTLALNDNIFALGKGAAQKNLDIPAFRGLSFAYPDSVIEQRRLVAILDEAFEAIAMAKANTEKSLQNTHELYDNFMQSLIAGTGLGWSERTLEDVCEIAAKLIDPRDPEHLDLPHIGAGNIESKSGAVVDVKTAREERLISGKFLFDDRTVLYSKIRPYLMKVVRPSFNGLCSADIYPLLPTLGRIDRDFLYYLLLTTSFTEYAIRGSARAGMPKVNREHLFAYRFRLPPIDEQSRLATKVDSVACETERLAEISKAKLQALDELKKSLLHQAFSGRLSAKGTDQQLAAIA